MECLLYARHCVTRFKNHFYYPNEWLLLSSLSFIITMASERRNGQITTKQNNKQLLYNVS